MSQASKPTIDFLLVRHGESQGNVNRKAYREVADEEIPLTAKGRRQARAVGKFLAAWLKANRPGEEVCMFVSSYGRARETAQEIFTAIARKNIVHVRETDLLAEQSAGIISGVPFEEWAKTHPQYAEQFERNRKSRTIHFSLVPGGETRAQVELRQRAFFNTLYRYWQDHGKGPCIIVSHGVTLRQQAKVLLGLTREQSDAQKNPDNCDVRLIRRREPTAPLIDYGYVWKKGKARRPRAVPRVRTTDLYKARAYARKPD